MSFTYAKSLLFLTLLISLGYTTATERPQRLTDTVAHRLRIPREYVPGINQLLQNPIIQEHVTAFYDDSTMSWKELCNRLVPALEARVHKTELERIFLEILQKSQGCGNSACIVSKLYHYDQSLKLRATPTVIAQFLDARARLGYTAEEYAAMEEAAIRRADAWLQSIDNALWKLKMTGVLTIAGVTALSATVIYGLIRCSNR